MRANATRLDKRLWLGVLLAPATWLLNEGIGYVVASRLCERVVGSTGPVSPTIARVTNLVICSACLLAALAGLWIAIGNWRMVRDARAGTTRATFLAIGGTFASTVFVVAIAMFGIPALVVNVCNQAR